MNAEMVFAIIFAIILMGFLFSMGFEQILSIFGVSGQAQMQSAVRNVERLSGELYHLAEGSSNTYPVSLPSGSKLCFLKQSKPEPNPARNWNPEPFIYNNMRLDPQNQYFGSNVWIYFTPTKQEGYKISSLEPVYNFCALSGSSLYFENKGVFVSVELL
jgi:hypothetical protein